MNAKRMHARIAGSSTVRPRWARLALGGMFLLGSAGALADHAWAQGQPQPNVVRAQAGAPLPEKTYMNKSAISLPVIVEERARACLKEIQLYVKEGAAGPWQKVQTVSPSATGFEYRMPHDGEFWFNVVTVDLSNIATPPDVSKEAPAVIVVLDTAKPQVDLKPMPPCGDGLCVKCDVLDANPNPLQTKLEYQTMNQAWWPVDAMSNQPDCFCIPRQAALSGAVRITCTDRAMNVTVREFNLTALGLISASGEITGGQPKTVTQTGYESPTKTQQAQPVQQPAPPAPAFDNLAKRPLETHQETFAPIPPAGAPVSQVASPVSGKWLMVNQPRVSMDFTVEDVGHSGIGKVTIWVTRDQGRTWDVLCDVADKKSPAVFDLPGEGVYGLRVAATNGRGFGSDPPKPGDAPECTVELNMTKPRVALGTVKLGPTNDSPCVDITWQAEGKNLGSGPIDLYYSSSPQGPWSPIAKGVANSGKYRWYLPQEISRQAYVRMAATDLAGNSTRSDISEPVTLDDGTRPVVRIGGIVPVPQGTAPIGN